MRDEQQADTVFVSDLERQLTRELRRKERFGELEPAGGWKRTAGAVLLIIFCMATGVAGARTAEHLESARKAELLAERAESRIALLRARQQAEAEAVAEMEQRVNAGLLRADELEAAKHQQELLACELERVCLELEEVQLAHRNPSDELFAAPAGERDFVSERLRLEQKAVAARKAHLREELVRIQQLIEAGLVHGSEADRLDADLDMLNQELAAVHQRLDLRAEYLSGELSAGEVSSRELVLAEQVKLESAARAVVKIAAERQKLLAAQEEGMVAESSVREAEARLDAARAEQHQAQIELELLEAALDREQH